LLPAPAPSTGIFEPADIFFVKIAIFCSKSHLAVSLNILIHDPAGVRRIGVILCHRFLGQNLADFGRKVFERERFLDEVYILVEHAVMADDIGRVAGHK